MIDPELLEAERRMADFINDWCPRAVSALLEDAELARHEAECMVNIDRAIQVLEAIEKAA